MADQFTDIADAQENAFFLEDAPADSPEGQLPDASGGLAGQAFADSGSDPVPGQEASEGVAEVPDSDAVTVPEPELFTDIPGIQVDPSPAPEPFPGLGDLPAGTGAEIPSSLSGVENADGMPGTEGSQEAGGAEDAEAGSSEDTGTLEGTGTFQESPEYTELLETLKLQNEALASLSVQVEQTNRQLSSIQAAFPVVTVSLGIIAGVLLLQVLASYIRH